MAWSKFDDLLATEFLAVGTFRDEFLIIKSFEFC